MVTITFPDRVTEQKGLAFLLGRFSGRVLKGGVHLVPEAALEGLAGQNIPFCPHPSMTANEAVAVTRRKADRRERGGHGGTK